jgi:hypothetical protein
VSVSGHAAHVREPTDEELLVLVVHLTGLTLDEARTLIARLG